MTPDATAPAEQPAKQRRVNAIISEALAQHRRSSPSRRHPADVTADRLGDAVTRWHDRFSPAEADMVGMVVHRLREIAEGVLMPADPRTDRRSFAVHRAPDVAGDPLPCCGRLSSELPARHVLTHLDSLVTCPDWKVVRGAG